MDPVTLLLILVIVPVVVVGPTLLLPQPRCPACGQPMPRVRLPTNRRQAMWGGWTCPKCSAELDRRATIIEPGRADVAQLSGGIDLSEEGAHGGLTQTAAGGLEVSETEVSFDFEEGEASAQEQPVHVKGARRGRGDG